MHLCADFNSTTRVTVYAECVKLTEYLKYYAYKGIAILFSLHGLPLVNSVCVPQLFQFSLLTPCFVHLFSGNLSVNLFAVCPFKYKLFIKILSSWLNTMLIVGKHCSDDCCDEFSVPQIDRKSQQVKEQCHGKFYLQSVWGKTSC